VTAPGETDLAKMLASLEVEQRDGVYTFVVPDEPTDEMFAASHATVVESEGITLVLPVSVAREHGLPVVVEMAWLTLTVQSSLEAVGLTAAFSARLGEHEIPCNVLAGFHHDHILVPAAQAADAIAALRFT